jgi:hypothetical protein
MSGRCVPLLEVRLELDAALVEQHVQVLNLLLELAKLVEVDAVPANCK